MRLDVLPQELQDIGEFSDSGPAITGRRATTAKMPNRVLHPVADLPLRNVGRQWLFDESPERLLDALDDMSRIQQFHGRTSARGGRCSPLGRFSTRQISDN